MEKSIRLGHDVEVECSPDFAASPKVALHISAGSADILIVADLEGCLDLAERLVDAVRESECEGEDMLRENRVEVSQR